MATKRVPSTAAQQKGGATPRPRSLTLADVAVTRRVGGEEVVRLNGSELARLIDGTQLDSVRPPLVSAEAVSEELDALAEILMALSTADDGVPLDQSLTWIGESLRRLSRRLMALDPCENAKPGRYVIEVTR
jgi:hypothetical protein